MNENCLFEEYEPIKQLLRIGDLGLVKFKKKEVKKKRGITNERQQITKEIQEIIEQENGGKINGRLLAIKLSHVDVPTLYFMKSEGLDYRKRTGQPFAKYIYGSVKVKKLSTP